MIDLIVEKIKDKLKERLGTAEIGGDGTYSDDLVPLVQTRSFRTNDPDRTICIFEDDEEPVDYEIGQLSPTITRYMVHIQVFAKGLQKEDTMETRRTLVKRIKKAFWEEGSNLRTELLQLSDTRDNIVERVQKYNFRRVIYDSAEIRKQFASIAQIDITIETEMNFD